MSRTIWFHLNTMFLFTKTDFKTVILPQSVFALAMVLSKAGSALAPSQGRMQIALRLPLMFLWLWIHLLVENIANQRLPEAILEDKENKPWRPMPTGRLSPDEALGFLRAAVPLVIGLSIVLGSFVPSVTLMTFIWLYNDLDGSSAGPIRRNIITTAGLCCFGWGAVTTLLAGDVSPEGERLLGKWMALTAAMLITTVHAQDFPDISGDIARGRQTMPLLYGKDLSRRTLAVLAVVWGVAFSAFWNVSFWGWLGPMCIGGAMAVLTLLRWDQSSNEKVWQLWCLWATAIYLLPLFSSRST